MNPVYILPKWRTEVGFIDNYLEDNKNIEWWFKNGDYGKEYFAIKYWNSNEEAYRLFYPDWIIKFKDGRIGIFDTKAGDTASKEKSKDKAKALHNKLKALGKNYIGGITVLENGIWYFNSSEEYDYASNKLNKNWKELSKIF